jgi:hypothetical protein
MSQRAKFVEEIKVIDPQTNGEVHLAVYKHENGGMFAIDSSFVDQVLEQLDEAETVMIMDPFEPVNPTQLYLEE